MKIAQTTSNTRKDQVQKRLREKFGDDFSLKKERIIKDKVEVRPALEGKNNKESSVSREQLKELVRNGGFDFGDRTRKVLAEILDV